MRNLSQPESANRSGWAEIEGDAEKGIKSFFEKLESRAYEERTWDSKFVKPFFIDDGVGKGLRPMLKRENEMPVNVKKAIEQELQEMEQDDYVV